MAADQGQDMPTRVFDFIVAYMRQSCGVPPSVREIQQQCNISTTSMVAYYLDKLAAAGLIEREAGEARNIRVPGALWIYPPADDQTAVYWSVVDSEAYIDDWARSFYPAQGVGE